MTTPTATTRRIVIPDWRPATLNELLSGRTWHKAARLKRADRDTVAVYANLSGVRAGMERRKRRVDVLVRPAIGRRKADRDAYWKSLLDALVHAGLLVDDADRWCVPGDVEHTLKGPPRTEITLTDLD